MALKSLIVALLLCIGYAPIRAQTISVKTNAAGTVVTPTGFQLANSIANRKRVPVLTRCTTSSTASGVGTIGHSSNGTDTLDTFRTAHYVTANCNNLSFVLFNGDAETPGSNSITCKCAIEDSSGNIYPIFFGGGRSATVAPGACVESDLMSIAFNKGDTVWLRTLVTCVSTGTWPLRIFSGTSGEGVDVGADVVDSGGTFSGFGTVYMFAPQLILGDVDAGTHALALIGDSIMCGQNSARAGDSYPVTALGNQFGQNFCYGNIGLGGDTTADFIQKLYRFKRGRWIRNCTGSLTDYGVNDLHLGVSAATLQANMVTEWTLLQNQFGIANIWQLTMLPSFASSTDGFTTTTNQTAGGQLGAGAAAYNASRTLVNNWLRDNAPIDATTHAVLATGSTTNAIRAGATGHPLSGVFDASTLAESATNSGIWKANYTSDGLHPSGGTPINTIATCIDTTKL